MQAEPSAAATAGDKALQRLVVKNTFYLMVSQALTVPIAIVVNAALARHLGAADFGFIYFASTLCGFGFLVVNWGQENALPALITRDRSQAGALLFSSVLWRIGLSAIVYLVLALACKLLKYDTELQWALGLTFVVTGLSSLIGACKDTIRGFERTDIPAYVHVGQQFLTALIVVPTLLLGGRMRMSLFVQIPVGAVVLWWIWRTLHPVGVGKLSYQRPVLKALLVEGTPFVFFGLATALQPNIDVVFLSKLAPSDVVGWFAVARRLIGVLLFPAGSLITALYPTLCRLHVEDKEAFKRVSRDAFSSVSLISVPIAMGCFLYPEIGVAMFSRASFAGAEGDLRVLAPFLFLLYFSMPLGCCVLASGRQKAFSLVQGLCVAVSAILDPILVPLFQRRMGNGGVGICVATVISEALVVLCALGLAPRGIFDRNLLRTLALAAIAGASMALAAWLLRPFLSPFLAAPLAVGVYLVALWLTGAVDKAQLASLKSTIGRKFSRN